MTSVGVYELKSHLSSFLARAGSGEEVLVTNRGKVIAQLGPPPVSELETEEERSQRIRERVEELRAGFAALKKVPGLTGGDDSAGTRRAA